MDTLSKLPAALLAAALLAAAPPARSAPMRVVTTTDYVASLARTIGGDKVSVTPLSPPGFDADAYSPRPQDLFKVHQAKLFIMIGLNLEDWARDLVNSANNPDLIKAEIYRGVPLLDKPQGRVDYSFGDIHPYGNPHFQLNPEDGRIMARNIEKALAYADPADEALFARNLAAFETRLTAAEARWKAEMAPYKGDAVLPYHESWDYFAQAFGLTIPEPPKTIEEKPGFVPSPRRIETVIQQAKSAGVKLVITEPYYDVSIAQTVAKSLGVPCLSLSLYDIGLNPKQTDYIAMVDDVVGRVSRALGGSADAR
ncbi:MAG: zinc ABC transporter substrate-binding protein [Elusimicrobia bacterium]|nr:zinc ABC transporter substrate-binding protein [Elusimicrobiota bacterium]